MSNINVTFCRLLYQQVISQVKKEFPEVKIRDAYVLKMDRGRWEFQYPPTKTYWYGQADNAWDAKVKGWETFLYQMERKK